ncbi:DnaT-like ssDNA-binding domain-containing protein [Pseudomonas sp.]|uniref:DnaT-like ssDNA-binding domain-containing protein n=1 Tax=Pseudomonas sp. TaxID=306 RepID=UPI003D6F2A0E
MPAFQINDDEWGALAEEPAELLKLYCAIRRFMDYRTGIAGIKRRLSEQMFREELYVAPLPGRHAPAEVTRQKVRSLLKRLEAIGMTKPIGPLVFELPLASWDGLPKTGATKEQPEEQPEEQPSQEWLEPNEHGGFSAPIGGAATAGETAGGERNNLPPISVNTYTAHTAHAKFAMTDAWEPIPTTFTGVLYRNGMAGQTFHPDQLLEFRSYWIANPDRHRTQAQWEHALAQQLKRQSRLQQSTEGYSHETRGRSSRSRTRNAHDILTDTNW